MSQKWRSYLWGEWLSLSKWRLVLSQSLGLVGSRISDRLPRVRRSLIKGIETVQDLFSGALLFQGPPEFFWTKTLTRASEVCSRQANSEL